MVPRQTSLGLIPSLCGLTCLSACVVMAAEPLVTPGAKVERLADGFAFTEGPACDAEGNIYFSDVRNRRGNPGRDVGSTDPLQAA